MDGLADDVVLCLEACNHVPEDGFFGLVAGVELHGDGDLVAVEQESQPDNRVLAVFLAGTLAAEIVFPVDFKVEVGAVKIGAGGIHTKNRLYLGSEYLDELLVIVAQEGKGGKELVIGTGRGLVELGEDFVEGSAFAAGVDGPGINEGK